MGSVILESNLPPHEFHISSFNPMSKYSTAILNCFHFQFLIYFTEDSRALAANVRGIGVSAQEVPEWKKHVIGGKKSSFGKKTDLSLIEQRQSLPIYKLRDDLIKVIIMNKPNKSLLTSSNVNL